MYNRRMPDLDRFAAWLKHRRIALGFTRDELAKRAHCSASTLRRLEAGDLRASEQLAGSLAQALALSADQVPDFTRFARGESVDPALFDLPAGAHVSAAPDWLAHPHNLPAPLTSLVGRKRDIDTVCELLQEAGVRLLTLTGPPGTGKTRLSIAAAQQLIETTTLFPDGAWFIPLAPIGNPTLVADTIAQVLGLRETTGEVTSLLREFLRSKRLLLVLDNFEQITDAAPLITDLLTNAPQLKAIVTSRAVLRVYGEHEYPVPPLALPDVQRLPTAQALSFYTRYAAVQLFKDRARAVKPDFQLSIENAADVARICAWLDGLPLAIEMAAAQVKWLPLPKLLEQLSDRLVTLTGGPRDLSPRQQSLTGAIDWSYHLLDPIEQQLFEVLGVFSGGCDEEAVAALGTQLTDVRSPVSVTRRLVEKSLLRYEQAGAEARFIMLESMREYAQEKLKGGGQFDRVRQAQAMHYLNLARQAAPHLERGQTQAAWLDRLEREHNNFRAALSWSTEAAARREFALELMCALALFWELRGYLSEGLTWLETGLTLYPTRTALRARALNYAGLLTRRRGRVDQAKRYSEEAVSICEELQDERTLALSLVFLGIASYIEIDRTRWRAVSPNAEADSESPAEYDDARALMERGRDIARRLSEPALLSQALGNLAIVARRQNELAHAEALLLESLELDRANHNAVGLVRTLHGLGNLHLGDLDYATAARFFQESIVYRQQIGDRSGFATAFNALATVLYQCGHELEAARLFGAEAAVREITGAVSYMKNRANWNAELELARQRVGAAVFEAEFAHGKSLPLTEAIKFALSLRVE
jgi:predicted ATPase/transcriptional regulator with XRE-family HTH domain